MRNITEFQIETLDKSDVHRATFTLQFSHTGFAPKPPINEINLHVMTFLYIIKNPAGVSACLHL